MQRVREQGHTYAQRPILLTGSHRSGSTWVGNILARSGEAGYIQEPFSPGHRPGICSMPVSRWFEYVTQENEAGYYEALEKTLQFSYNTWDEWKALRTPKDVLRMIRDWSLFLYHQVRNVRPLMKDPIAFFSAEWIADRFGADVVVLVRHPAAFASSLKRLNWTHDFSQFLEQPLMMRDLLGPFEKDLRAYAEREHDIIDQAALLWKIIYHVAARYREAHPEWIFVRHEDLSLRPAATFRSLFDALDLTFTPGVAAAIKASTGADNPEEVPEGAIHYLKRNSKANIWNWKNRLTGAEVERIRSQVDDVAALFYDEEDW